MKNKLSFYITIKDITIRLKKVSLRTISYAAEQLANLENADELKIMVTPVTQHYDYVTDDAKVFIDLVKKAVRLSNRSQERSAADRSSNRRDSIRLS